LITKDSLKSLVNTKTKIFQTGEAGEEKQLLFLLYFWSNKYSLG